MHEYGSHIGNSLSQREVDSNCWSISDSQPVCIQSQDPKDSCEVTKNSVQTNEVLLEISRVDDHLYEHVDSCRKDIDVLKEVLIRFTRRKQPGESALEKHLEKIVEGNERLHDICRRSLCATLDISRSLEIKLQKMDAVLESITGISVPGAVNGTPPMISFHSGYSDSSPEIPGSPFDIISSASTIDEQEAEDSILASNSLTRLKKQSAGKTDSSHASQSKPADKKNSEKISKSAEHSSKKLTTSQSTSKSLVRATEVEDEKKSTRIAEKLKTKERIYCKCRRPQFGNMVACDNAECQFEWFHYRCVGLRRSPAGDWYCQDCANKRNQPAQARKRLSSESMRNRISESQRLLRPRASK